MIRRAKFKPGPSKPHIHLDPWTCQMTAITYSLKKKLNKWEIFDHKEALLYCRRINPGAPYKNPEAAVKALYTTFRGELCTN